MMYLVLLVTVALISTTSGTVDVLYLRGVPRLNNPSYWDYYFSCNAVGTTLQWDVNNNTLGGFLGGNVAQILNGTTSNFSYIATLLSSKVTLERQFTFDSVLIVSLRGNFNLNVVCRNGSSSDSTVSMDNGLGVEEKINSTSVFLEHLLTQNIVGADDSRHTSIFICGVENQFMTWRINGVADAEFSFTAFDVIGQERRSLQENDTAVKQQAIFISREPYRLVTALFVIDTSEVTVTCGYTQNEVQLTSKSENPTVPEASTSEASSSSILSGGTTTTPEDNTVVTAIASFFTILFVISSVIAIIIIIVIVYKKIIKGTKRFSPKSEPGNEKEVVQFPIPPEDPKSEPGNEKEVVQSPIPPEDPKSEPGNENEVVQSLIPPEDPPLRRVSDLSNLIDGKHPSYHGVLSRDEAVVKLNSKSGHCYLVRYSETRRVYVLSIRDTEVPILHITLVVRVNKLWLIFREEEKKIFESLDDLLNHYKEDIGEACRRV